MKIEQIRAVSAKRNHHKVEENLEEQGSLQRIHGMFTPGWWRRREELRYHKVSIERACFRRSRTRYTLPSGLILVMRRAALCFPVKATVPITRLAVTNSAGAGRNTSSASKSSGLPKVPICASTGSCVVPFPDSCGRMRPGIPCTESEAGLHGYKKAPIPVIYPGLGLFCTKYRLIEAKITKGTCFSRCLCFVSSKQYRCG